MMQTNARLIRRAVLSLLLLLVLLIVPIVLLDGAQYVPLRKSTVLGGIVSQAIGVGDNGKLQQEGSDFVLQDTEYFDNKTWVVSHIHNLRDKGDSYVLFRQNEGVYKVVLGPGTAFDRAYTKSMPSDVTQYLDNKGILYDS